MIAVSWLASLVVFLGCSVSFGTAVLVSRVQGGAAVVSTSTPITWQVFLTIASERACAAVLISSTKLLTAAHCVRDLSLNRTYAPSGIAVCVGHSRTNCVQRSFGVRMWIHPSYQLTATGQFPAPVNLTDLAMLETLAPISTGPQASPIALGKACRCQ